VLRLPNACLLGAWRSRCHYRICRRVLRLPIPGLVLFQVVGPQTPGIRSRSTSRKSLLVAVPALGGALLRLVFGPLADHPGAKQTALFGLALTLVPLVMGWLWSWAGELPGYLRPRSSPGSSGPRGPRGIRAAERPRQPQAVNLEPESRVPLTRSSGTLSPSGRGRRVVPFAKLWATAGLFRPRPH
jgi:hypothetical protein